MTGAQAQLIVSRTGNWVWRAEADIDPDLVRSLTAEEFQLVQEALPKLLESIIRAPRPEPEPAGKRKK